MKSFKEFMITFISFQWLLLKHSVGTISTLVLIVCTIWWAPLLVSIKTRPMDPNLPMYNWGSIWGTFDNPPQGDRGWLAGRAWFGPSTTGWRGYANRVAWIIRNPLYNWKLKFMVKHKECTEKMFYGNSSISDKYKIPGWLFVTGKCGNKLKAWEFYCVLPYSKTRNLRIRWGWKIKGDKFDEAGEFAQLVATMNPFDSYGDD